MQTQNWYFVYSINPSFWRVYRFFVLSCENKADSRRHTWYYFSTVEIKDYSAMINERNFFDQLVRNNISTYKKIIKIATV